MPIIRDLYEANAEPFIASLTAKLTSLKAVRATAVSGRDYAETITAQIRVIEAALAAASEAHNRNAE